MKVTTKTGDNNYTSIVGSRILKSDIRIEAYGSLDELNTQVGLLHYYLEDSVYLIQVESIMDLIRKCIRDLARIDTEDYFLQNNDILYIEDCISGLEASLESYTLFDRPIGNRIFHQANITRAITRRCERNIVRLNQETPINKDILKFINRLSDYFFLIEKIHN